METERNRRITTAFNRHSGHFVRALYPVSLFTFRHSSLPFVDLIGVFSFSVTADTDLAFTVGIIYTLGLVFILVASIFAAFLPTAPFQSPLSDSIRFIFKIFPNYPLPGLRKSPNILRISLMILASVALAVMAAIWTMEQWSIAYIALISFPVACVSALVTPHPEKKEKMKPRIYGLPAWALFSSFTTIAALSISAWIFVTHDHPTPFLIAFTFGCVLIPVQGYHAIQLSKSAPDTTTAEAVTWMLMNLSSQSVTWFQKAVKIGSSEVKRAVLLENLLPLLSPLITSTPHHHPPAALHPDQVVYVTCLAQLCDFEPSTGSFWTNLWHNEVAFPRPLFSKDLEERLQQLRDCYHCPREVRVRAKLALEFSDTRNMASSQRRKEKVSEKSVV